MVISFDIIILFLLFLSCLIGTIRGFTREVLSLFSWAGAATGTFFIFPFLKSLARTYIQNTFLADGVTIITLFIIILIILNLISHTLSGCVKKSALGGIDRFLGFAFGLPRGFLFICLVEIVSTLFLSRSQQPEGFVKSRSAPFIYKVSDFLIPLLPSTIQDLINKKSHQKIPINLPSISDEDAEKQAESFSHLMPKKAPKQEKIHTSVKAIEDLLRKERYEGKN